MRLTEVGRSRLFLGLVVGLAGGAVAQGVALSLLARKGGATASVAPPLGAPADVLVHEAGARSSRQLKDIGAGSCRLIVVYSPVCGASLTAARRWHQDIMGSPDIAALPAGWTAVWLSNTDSAAAAGFLPEGFRLRRLYTDDGNAVADRLGVQAFPAHLILDRHGTILGGGVGAPLYQKGAYSADCRVVPRPVDPNAP